MISRNWFLFRWAAIVISGIGLLLSLQTEPNSIWRWIGVIVLCICVFILYFCLRCPHCGHVGPAPRPHEKDAGYCSFCGELVEWKEYQD